MDVTTLKSYAKINLGLRLIRKRQDGYHDIATVFQQLDLADTLIFRKTDGGMAVQSQGFSVPTGDNNLVCRAFDLFKHKTGICGGLSVRIQKSIPVGAGLGGGSSNAAATLSAVNLLWNRGLSRKELAAMAASIGSDVPFFVFGGTALGEGRGEILTPIHWNADFWVVLICPDVPVSTAWAYSQVKLSLTKSEKLTNFNAILGNYTPQNLRENFINEFEDVVFQKHPEFGVIKDELYGSGAFYASMSGSGSSLYGFFSHRDEAERVLLFFSERSGCRAFLTRPVLTEQDEGSGTRLDDRRRKCVGMK
jgi:4-diphosphocytidyl-2-C-methyl-D-erythritol kinase